MTPERDSAKKIIEYLNAGVAGLDDRTIADLEAARKQAVAAMPAPAQLAHAELAHAGFGQFLSRQLHGRQAWMTMLAMMAIILMVVALVQKNSTTDPVEADALLLGSDLPPEAYVDKGFDAWLENSSQP
jgi:hypothetical protein